MKWRPKGFKNPFSREQVDHCDRSTLVCRMKDGTCMPNLIRQGAEANFEAGADAMLEGLRDIAKQEYAEAGAIHTQRIPIKLKAGCKPEVLNEKSQFGYYVFIPDD